MAEEAGGLGKVLTPFWMSLSNLEIRVRLIHNGKVN
jgi:hypothetical protein